MAKSHIKKKEHNSGQVADLYIPMNDYSEKRKSLLIALKDTLIVQDESEKVLTIRKRKAEILREIKKNMDSLNSDYQKVKKLMPNVKNVISNTEKEISELDSHILMLKGGIDNSKEDIDSYEHMKKNNSFKEKPSKEEVHPAVKKKEHVKKEVVKHVDSKVSKMDRIKNNLSVIEAKLKNI